jgi:serine/threonine protein kinase
MEYVTGNDLAHLIKKEAPLPINRAAFLMRQVASGLAAAHSQSIIHRDIKPANILLADNDHVKITDFGLARLQAARTVTQIGHAIGSPSYMSPEQAQDLPIDGRTDIFAMGVMFYEMITGRRPFVAEHHTAVLIKIIQEQPAPPSYLISNIDPEIDALVMRLLAKNPDDRFASSGEVEQIFARLAGMTSATPPSISIGDDQSDAADKTLLNIPAETTTDLTSSQAVLPVRRHKLRFAALVLLLVISIAAAIGVVENSDDLSYEDLYTGRVFLRYKSMAQQDISTISQQVTPVVNAVDKAVNKAVSDYEAGSAIPPALVVTTDPSGATVIVDGVTQGETPITLSKLPVGEHEVTLRWEGKMEYRKNVIIEDDIVTRLSAVPPAGGEPADGESSHDKAEDSNDAASSGSDLNKEDATSVSTPLPSETTATEGSTL